MPEKKIIILLLFILISLKYKINKDKIESMLMRYNNKFRGKNISVRNIEDNLMIYILYAKSIKEGKIKKIIQNKKYDNPKISFIISVFNKEKYLDSLIISMQMQDLKEIEIVFVDDFSSDKSVKIINKFRKRDKRIILINNKKNMGSLYSRAIGAKIAKGDYFIFFDSDDIILKEGILKAYNHIVKYKLDLVHYLSIMHTKNYIYTTKYFYQYKNVIKQPILSYIFFYYKKSGVEQNFFLWDKLVKKEVVLKSLKYIGKNFIQSRILIENDVVLLYSILKIAESYQFIESPGYYYFVKNKDSITDTKNDPIKTNDVIRSILMNIQFLFQKTGTIIFIVDSQFKWKC
jgi:glycosyltransferase involved in cell wall biosynthesis